MAGSDGQRVALVWDEALTGYDFGQGHPLAPVRVELTVRLIEEIGLAALGHVDVVEPGTMDEAEVLRVHRPKFVKAVKKVSADPTHSVDWSFGIGPGDTPAFAGMHDASMRVCAASREAARLVLSGEAIHAFNPAGGLHHAMPDRAAGFCVYNDPAVAIDWMLEQGVERIAYVDVDVHHGDGVETMFADDPRVLTISLHESGRFLFPGTGAVDDIGGLSAPGSALNLPFHPGTTGPVWLEAFDAVVDPLLRGFRPDVLVTQLGCDTHARDPLAHLALRLDDHVEIHQRLHALAHELCEGRWVATGGGGYQVVEVVPRSWAAAFAVMNDVPLPVELPMRWRELAGERTGQRAPTSFWDDPLEVDQAVDVRARAAAREVVAAARRLVLPLHGAR